jgi:hypothetical protein
MSALKTMFRRGLANQVRFFNSGVSSHIPFGALSIIQFRAEMRAFKGVGRPSALRA